MWSGDHDDNKLGVSFGQGANIVCSLWIVLLSDVYGTGIPRASYLQNGDRHYLVVLCRFGQSRDNACRNTTMIGRSVALAAKWRHPKCCLNHV